MINVGQLVPGKKVTNTANRLPMSAAAFYDDSSCSGSSQKSRRPRTNTMSMDELLVVAQPLMGPDFDPSEHIEDWSDDSSDDMSARGRNDEDMLEELMMSGPLPLGGVPLRRTVAAIYMPIRVNCLYG